MVAISRAHDGTGVDLATRHVVVREVLRGIHRTAGAASTKKAAIGTNELKAMLAAIPDSLVGCRDRALLLLGFAAALRRSELVGLNVEDLKFMPEQGLIVLVRKSKTDQEGWGREITVPYGRHPETCAVLAVKGWLERAGLRSGPLFRHVRGKFHVATKALSDRAVARLVQRSARATGLNADQYGAHSLRSGFVTSAAALGIAEHEIQEVSGHRSVQVLRGYVRHGSLFAHCALRDMDL
jgi:integrase